MIKVILMERIERLGKMGDTVSVRPGFARNYLLPQKKALRATKENMAVFEKQRAELEAKSEALRVKAQEVADTMKDLKLTVIRQASEMGMLFGSVSARDVADAAKESGKTIERQMIQIDTPIKTLGLFPIKVKLHPEVSISITVNVARSEAEAAAQIETAKQEAAAEGKKKKEKSIKNAEAADAEAPEEAKEEKAE